MPLKTGTVEEPKLDLTPMIDIVFLLIIFFMVGTQFTEMERQYDIKLPTVTDAKPLTNLPDDIIVNVQQNGDITLNGEKKNLEELESTLATAKENFPGQSVVIRGDSTGPYQNVMNILEICHRVKIRSVSLANRLRDE
ncbi:ExbD/TolR family protein [Gimesia fumaroli]|uniref:Biopolymer transport protein ExbD n=1 Tax=Gimesia fumaroli TaxID=2527976 RepID=A0A518IL87_9PLAN|nr:biopolymer transporter ExbD [Gimesia fumaroli]QDV53862.1 biopolymer transport protein ExbD [Gimesia fumaroli]